MYSIRQIQSRNPEHPLKVSSFIYLLDKMSRVILGNGKVLGGESCFLRLNPRKWSTCQKITTVLDGISEFDSVSFLLSLAPAAGPICPKNRMNFMEV